MTAASQRCETIALEHKRRQHLGAHCSSVTLRIRHARHSGNVRSALFWGYSCVKTHSEYRPLILATLRARSILSCGKKPSLLFDGPVVPQAVRGDKRITGVGRVLRRTSLDELPQLINVLRGELSLVGPRPHAVSHNDEFAKLLGGYPHRLKVKPGITGWAQVNGFRGETKTLEAMRQRLDLDLHYIKYWSLWLDMKILGRTIFVPFFSPNAY